MSGYSPSGPSPRMPPPAEALSRLRSEASARPDRVLLDLNLPGMDGRERLEEMRRDPGLRDLPVAIVTASLAEADAFCARQLARVVQAVTALWLVIVATETELPPALAAVCG